MNRGVLQGKWKQIRGKVREQWGQMADHELDKIAGKREQLAGLVQERNGYTKEKAEQGIDNILKRLNVRPANGTHAFSILAVCLGALLAIALFGALARRLASA